MYDDETYSGAGAGSDRSGADSGRNRESDVHANVENGGVGMNENMTADSNAKNNEDSESKDRSAGVYSGQYTQETEGVKHAAGQEVVNSAGSSRVSGYNNTDKSYGSAGSSMDGSGASAGNSYGGTGNSAFSGFRNTDNSYGSAGSLADSSRNSTGNSCGSTSNTVDSSYNGTGTGYGSAGNSSDSSYNGTGIGYGSTGNSTNSSYSSTVNSYGSTGNSVNGSLNSTGTGYGSTGNSTNSSYSSTVNSYGSTGNPVNGSYSSNGTNNSYSGTGSAAGNNYNSTGNVYGSSSGQQTGSVGSFGGNGTENNFYNEYETSPVLKQDDSRKKKEHREKKPGGFFRKAVLAVSLGLFFGLFAGIGFVAVQQASGMAEKGNGKEAALSQNVDGSDNTSKASDETKSGIKVTDTSSVRVVSSDVSDVVDEVMPAMVSIVNKFTQTGMTMFGQTYSQEAAASGTGIIVAESESELLIVTNHHVVADTTTLEVTFIDGSTAQAQVKGTDSDMDLAVIAIPLESLTEETINKIAVATLGDSDALKMGEPVIAIGNALGYGQSVTNGIVSALNREISLEDGSTGTFIQTNAAINPGNSGGALLNVNGEVIGINSNKIGGSTVEGMGYAIPISAAKPIIADLMLKETRTKVEDGQTGYMGITLQTITEQFSQMYKMPQGIYVTGVEDGSPAKEAGILSGDIIVNFDGEKIESYEDLQNVLQYYASGSTAKIVVKRPQNGEYQSIELEITLGSKPASQQ